MEGGGRTGGSGVEGEGEGLVYDILPSTAVVFSYAIGPRKLSANEEFFVGAQTVGAHRKAMLGVKLQALVYDILPSTAAVFSYAIGPRKLSANEQFFLLVLKQ